MEPPPGAAQELGPAPDARFVMRLAAACALLVGLAMVQAPGLITADTKFDLAVDPLGFLDRATRLWDAEGAFGQLQNQAYGYLWPTGPFFVLGSLTTLPAWVVQRLWAALVLSVALTGAAVLARRLGVRSDLACLVAGFAYALSPRMLTTVGPISSESWPCAVAPWVLLPLVVGSSQGSPRRAAALSALAIGMAGGVNAAATSAVLPLGAIWLLTRTPGARRRALMRWWPAFTLLATAWWLVPLFLMGSYSPPFLDFIESASTTTFPTTLFDALRGTSDWVAYLDPTWQAGGDLLKDFYLPLNSGVVLLFGVAGLARRESPHRLFLVTGLIAGLVLVTLGHTGAVHGWNASSLQGLLDGTLAPLRNIHKFDPVVRLPLVVGLALSVDALVATRRASAEAESAASIGERMRRANALVLVFAAVGSVLGAAIPVTAGRLAVASGVVGTPMYWAEAADWLDRRDQGGTALLVPGSASGRYVWGFPRDEPMQWLARSPWAVRNAVPLTPPGNIRMLDAIEERLAQGRPSTGLATFLGRAGVSYLVVRNDLVRSGDIPDPLLVHQALDNSIGFARVAAFGPEIGGEAHLERDFGRVLINGGWQGSYPAVEIYSVDEASGPAVASDVVPVVVGGPEDLLDLADLGIVGEEPVELASDVEAVPDPSRPLVLTDGMVAAEHHFGRVHDGTSATWGPGDERRLGNPTRDYLLGSQRWTTKAALAGLRSLSASSSMSDADARGPVQRGQLPYAAVDGERSTAWVANTAADPAWWQMDFESDRAVSEVRVRGGSGGRQVIRVRTRHETTDPVEVTAGAVRTIRLAEDSTGYVRIEDASGRAFNQLSLSEVEVPGVRPRRQLVLPAVPDGWGAVDVIVLRSGDDARDGCVRVAGDIRCVEGRQVVGEDELALDRLVDLDVGEVYAPEMTARARDGRSVERLVAGTLFAAASASSSAVSDVRGGPFMAIDATLGTTWFAALAETRPTLALNWVGEQRVRGIRLWTSRDAAARRPTTVELVWPGGRRTVELDRRGAADLEPFRTDRVEVRVIEAEPATSLSFEGTSSPVPVGISEIRLRGVRSLPLTPPTEERRWRCGSGPRLTVDGRSVDTAVVASPAALLRNEVARVELCDDQRIYLGPGRHEVRATSSSVFAPEHVVLRARRFAPQETYAAGLEQTDAVTGRLAMTGDHDLVAVRRNLNPGWVATQDGVRLRPRVVDGWQQAWDTEGSGAVDLRFAPDRWYGVGLLVGGAALLGLLGLLAAVRAPRWPGSQLPSARERGAGRLLPLAAAPLVGGQLASTPGAALALAAALAVVLGRRSDTAGRWTTAALVLPAAVAYAVRPWGSASGWAGSWGWPQLMVVVVCGALLGWLSVDGTAAGQGMSTARRLRLSAAEGRRWRNLMPGTSTKR